MAAPVIEVAPPALPAPTRKQPKSPAPPKPHRPKRKPFIETQARYKVGQFPVYSKAPGSDMLYSLEAEVSALGAMMSDRYAAMVGCDLLRPHHFCGLEGGKHHPVVMEAILRLWHQREEEGKGGSIAVIEPLLVAEELKRMRLLNSVGGQKALEQMTLSCAAPANIEAYCNIIRSAAKRRSVIMLTEALQDACYQPDADINITQIIDSTLHGFQDIREDGHWQPERLYEYGVNPQ